MDKKYLQIAGVLLLCGSIGTRLCYANGNEVVHQNQQIECVQIPINEPEIVVENQDNENEAWADNNEGSENMEGNVRENFPMTIPFIKKENPYSLFTCYSQAIFENDYAAMLGASLNILPSEQDYEIWKSYETYQAGYEIYANEDHALYAVILTFINSGELKFPEMEGEYAPGVCRYLYVTKKDGYWYADGPLHRELPSEDWWDGVQYKWEMADSGFSDGADAEERYIITQEDMNIFNRKSIAYTQRLFQCDPSAMESGPLSY